MTDTPVAIGVDGNPILDQFGEDGFVDCTFRIAELVSTRESHRLRLLASHGGMRVGLDAIVARGIRGGFDPEMELIREHVYRPAVRFLRSGIESDDLIKVLAELYGFPPTGPRMVDAFSFTGIALHQDDVDMETQPIKIKLFGCDMDEEIERNEYFESFFNLDLTSRIVSWNEKDPDYRAPLIRALSKP